MRLLLGSECEEPLETIPSGFDFGCFFFFFNLVKAERFAKLFR